MELFSVFSSFTVQSGLWALIWHFSVINVNNNVGSASRVASYQLSWIICYDFTFYLDQLLAFDLLWFDSEPLKLWRTVNRGPSDFSFFFFQTAGICGIMTTQSMVWFIEIKNLVKKYLKVMFLRSKGSSGSLCALQWSVTELSSLITASV